MRLRDRRHHCDTHSLSVVSVVRVLAAVVLVGMGVLSYAALNGLPPAGEIKDMTGMALGALIAMLSQTGSGVAQAHIVNPPEDPIPTEDVSISTNRKDE